MDPETKHGLDDQDLFLIELVEGDHVRYVVAERFLTIEPDHDALGVPWSELRLLFERKPLRAVPMPGRRNRPPLHRDSGVSTDPGVSTNVEVNLVKVERGD